MRALNKFVDAIIDGIESFTDYFIVRKHVTLSEGFLFTATLGRAVWFTIFGVNVSSSPSLLINEAWTPIFWLLTVAHFASFCTKRPWIRSLAVAVYAFVWCFLAILVALSQFSSPALPTFSCFALLSVFISIRLQRESNAV